MKSQSREKIEEMLKAFFELASKKTVNFDKAINLFAERLLALIDEAKAEERTSLLGEIEQKIGRYYTEEPKGVFQIILSTEQLRKALEDVGGGKHEYFTEGCEICEDTQLQPSEKEKNNMSDAKALNNKRRPFETTTHTETMEERFDKKVNELRNANYKTEKPVDFGYRYTNAVSDEIYSATDWGNVKKFIRQEIQSAVSKAEKRMIEKIEKELEHYMEMEDGKVKSNLLYITLDNWVKLKKKLLTNSPKEKK